MRAGDGVRGNGREWDQPGGCLGPLLLALVGLALIGYAVFG